MFSLAFFDNLDDPETPRFFVFLGYGNEEEDTYHEIWYFVFELDNSVYDCLACGEFDNILAENQYFRQLTLAPKDEDGICRLVVGYTEEVETDVWRSFFRVGYLTQVPLDRLSFNSYDPDYLVVLRVLPPLPAVFPKSIQYMGVIARHEIYDLVILTVGYLTPPDDVLLVHELGDVTNPLRTSSGSTCGGLLDHPWYFAKIQITEDSSTETNIAIVRNNDESGYISFVRYVTETESPPDPPELTDYKMILEENGPVGSPEIPGECALFHMDSGDMTNDGNGDDLVVIWKECPEYCALGEYVLKIINISPEDPPEDCLDIVFAHSFVTQFKEDEEYIDDLREPMYIRYTAKEGGYFLSLFYHDTDDGISVHFHEYTF